MDGNSHVSVSKWQRAVGGGFVMKSVSSYTIPLEWSVWSRDELFEAAEVLVLHYTIQYSDTSLM